MLYDVARYYTGLAATLKGLLKDQNGVVRERSAHVLGIIARKLDRVKQKERERERRDR